MTTITKMVLDRIDQDIRNNQETDNAELYGLITEYYREGATWDTVYSFGHVQVPAILIADIVCLITLAETSLMGEIPCPPIQHTDGGTRAFAVECFKKAKDICVWLIGCMGKCEIDTVDDDQSKRIMTFLDVTKIYRFNMIDTDGDLMIPVTKGFCQQPPLSKEITETDPYKKLLVIESGYLEPMLRYFERTSLRAKVFYTSQK